MTKNPLIRLHLFGFAFTPKLLPTIATFVLVPILIALGFWQLHRADVKRAILQDYQARQQSQPLQLAEIKDNWQQYRYYPLQLTGHYDNAHTILLDNKMHDHRPGYQVLTPFIVSNKQGAVLINRGWIPQGATRQQLPAITPIHETLTLTGRIDLPPTRSFMLSADTTQVAWPLLSQAINLPYYEKIMGQPLLPVVILLSPNSPGGFIREWQPVTISPYKNLGYALQWFALAAALAIIFIVVNTRRVKA